MSNLEILNKRHQLIIVALVLGCMIGFLIIGIIVNVI